jgi:hypothetical protein
MDPLGRDKKNQNKNLLATNRKGFMIFVIFARSILFFIKI